jgi:hypothetical protein
LECYEKYTLEKILKREKRDEATLNGDAELDSDSGDDDFGKGK